MSVTHAYTWLAHGELFLVGPVGPGHLPGWRVAGWEHCPRAGAVTVGWEDHP